MEGIHQRHKKEQQKARLREFLNKVGDKKLAQMNQEDRKGFDEFHDIERKKHNKPVTTEKK